MPASIQKVSGKGRFAHKNFYQIQPYLPNEKRPTFRLGTSRKRAEVAARAIGDLVDSLKFAVDVDPSTRHWLENEADKKLCQAMKKHGVIETLPSRFQDREITTISKLAETYIETRCVGRKESTVSIVRRAKKDLVACFGDVEVTRLEKRDGREFWRWLIEDKGYSENTAKQRLRYARAFFNLALEDRLAQTNPLKAQGLSVSQSAAQKPYVARLTIQQVAGACDDLEWKLLFLLDSCCRSRTFA